MPTTESNLARVLLALLSVARENGEGVTCEPIEVHSLGHVQKAYRLTMNSPGVLDCQHADAVMEAM